MGTLEDTVEAFKQSFQSSFVLIDQLLASQTHLQEILLLSCARLDAMASTASPFETNRKAFVDFVCKYGGQNEILESVSAGDIYATIYLHGWMLPVTVQAPGRLHRYSSDDEDFFKLLDTSGVALTEDRCRTLVNRILASILKQYRVRPNQPKSRTKAVRGSQDSFRASVQEAFDSPRWREHKDGVVVGYDVILRKMRIAEILYARFRNMAIHQGIVNVNESRFFKEDTIYWDRTNYEYTGDFYFVEFPGLWLRDLMARCLNQYCHHLLGKGRVPPQIFFRYSPDSDAYSLIDDDLVEDHGAVHLRL